MGARVRASRRDSITATEMVTPNWKKNFPMMPFMKITGTKMARMAMVAAMAAKVISRAPTSAACTLATPVLPVAHDVFQHHDGVVHHDADGQREAQEGEGVQREPQKMNENETCR